MALPDGEDSSGGVDPGRTHALDSPSAPAYRSGGYAAKDTGQAPCSGRCAGWGSATCSPAC